LADIKDIRATKENKPRSSIHQKNKFAHLAIWRYK